MLQGKQRLLIVDDEEGIRRSVKRALRQEKYDILMAESGPEAINIVQENPASIAVVISDYKMPEMDGIETLTAIGNINSDITRIILTGYATLDGAIQATNAGVDGFLTKPFENEELRAKIREYFLKKHMKQFVSPQVFEELQKSPDEIRPRKCTATILFTDIRGFTSMAENLDPVDLSYLLNNYYFSPLGQIIFDNRGTLDKHIGDSVMALYGVPLSDDSDAFRAVKSAIEMREKLKEINLFLRKRNTGSLLEANLSTTNFLPVGIGISTGTVVAGLFGSSRKKEYSAIGSAVNVAARIQSLAKAGEVLIGEETFKECRGKVEVEPLEPTMIKGISEPIQIYKVIDLL